MDSSAPERPRPTRRTLAFILGPIIAVVVVGTLGNMFHPRLLRDHPLWLVAMEPRNRYLLLVADKVDFVPYLVVATVRRLVSDPLFYLIGVLYGDAGVRWIERRLGDDVGLVRGLERWFRRAAPLMVFLFPGAIVCVLAGATGMSPVLFLAANVLGTLTVVSLLYRFAEFFDGPLGAVNRFYANNTRLLTVISVVATLVWIWDQRRRGRSELKSISTMERELEEAEEDPPEHDRTRPNGVSEANE
ncbi:MAG: DedA family protein [Acidimicrobiia bacterium]